MAVAEEEDQPALSDAGGANLGGALDVWQLCFAKVLENRKGLIKVCDCCTHKPNITLYGLNHRTVPGLMGRRSATLSSAAKQSASPRRLSRALLSGVRSSSMAQSN